MRKSFIYLLFLVLSYVLAFVLIYMSLTNTGIFQKRLEAKFKDLSVSMANSMKKILSQILDMTRKFSGDLYVKTILIEKNIGGNRREYINYLSRMRSNIDYLYKIVLLDNEGNFIVSSSFQENEFPEFELAKQYILDREFAFFGNRSVIYAIYKSYDATGKLLGYVVTGWHEDLFMSKLTGSLKSIKFIQDLVLVNSSQVIQLQNFDSEYSKKLKDKILSTSGTTLITSKTIDEYNIGILFFKSGSEIDFLNILVVIISIILALMVTLLFIVYVLSDRRLRYVEEIKEATLDDIEKMRGYESSILDEETANIHLDEKKKEELKRLASEVTGESLEEFSDQSYKFEEIETPLVPSQGGGISELSVFKVDEAFEFIKNNLNVKKVMYLKKKENMFIQVESDGFVEKSFFISQNDKVWKVFLSKGKAISVKGSIKELYELGPRIQDDVFEIIILPVLDTFGEVKHIFMAARSWADSEISSEDKRYVASKLKTVFIDY